MQLCGYVRMYVSKNLDMDEEVQTGGVAELVVYQRKGIIVKESERRLLTKAIVQAHEHG